MVNPRRIEVRGAFGLSGVGAGAQVKTEVIAALSDGGWSSGCTLSGVRSVANTDSSTAEGDFPGPQAFLDISGTAAVEGDQAAGRQSAVIKGLQAQCAWRAEGEPRPAKPAVTLRLQSGTGCGVLTEECRCLYCGGAGGVRPTLAKRGGRATSHSGGQLCCTSGPGAVFSCNAPQMPSLQNMKPAQPWTVPVEVLRVCWNRVPWSVVPGAAGCRGKDPGLFCFV